MTGGRLTTHVLDTARGKPAEGLKIALYRLTGEVREKLADAITNADGRTASPLLAGPAFAAGQYEIVFAAGDYLRGAGQTDEGPAFLDDIPVRFGIADPAAHYHVPLLLSPFAYSTYRGS